MPVERRGAAIYSAGMLPSTLDAAPVSGLRAAREARTISSIRRSIVFALDLIIAVYALGLVTVFLVGGINLGIFSVTHTAKPILVLLLAVPVRVAIEEDAWSLNALRPLIARGENLVIGLTVDRVPAAVVDVAFTLIATRTATFAIGFIANVVFRPSRDSTFAMPFGHAKFVEIFAAWDSGWYFDIARRGYYFNPSGQSSVAFFPLYPLLMRWVAWPFGGSDKAIWVAGIVVSCAAFAFALLALHRLTAQIFGDREVARRAVLYLAIFPFSLFLTKVYAESVLLLTSVLAISAAYDERWGWAGVWGALATLARPNGILIGLPLALMALRGRPGPRLLLSRCAPLLLVAGAMAGYCAYVYSLSGDPLGWLSAQANWGYSLGHPPWEQLVKMITRIEKYGVYDYFFISKMAPFRLFHGVAALIFLILTPAIFKRLGVPMGAYVLVNLLVPLSGNALEGIGRYSAVLFPAFMLVGSFKSPRLHEALLIVAPLFLALFISLFVTLYPIY
jgi:mannosyltransferase PIG-V